MKKSTHSRKPLNRKIISKAALQLIDENGMDALSMRRLGKALKVEAMALYHHFANKGELLDAVLELLTEEMELPPQDSLLPQEWLRLFAREHRQLALRHPHAFILIPTRRFNTESAIALYEKVLQAFNALGFDGALSARYFRTIGYFVSGAGLADIASHSRQPDSTPVRLETFNDPHFPLVSAVVPHLQAKKLDAIFEFGLDIIFEAMERDVEEIKGKK